MKPADYKPFPPEVHEYVDGRLTSSDEREFERRMAGNEQLRGQVRSLQAALGLLHGLPVKDPGDSFDARVIGRVREEELAERARSQIIPAPTPLWKHVVQIGAGAMAAALVFALVGFPGLFGGGESISVEDGASLLAARPTEDDLLPALADHKSRFESLARNVSTTSAADPRSQRRLIALELEHSDLVRRNRWLASQVEELPSDSRAGYREFIDSLDEALDAIDAEMTESRSENRAVNLSLIRRALDEVAAPQGHVSEFEILRHSGELVQAGPEINVGTPRAPDEIGLYSLVRRADYRHDHGAVVDAADIYLKHFPRGRFSDHAHAAALAALLKLGDGAAAARRFIDAFGEYDEDIEAHRQQVVRGLLTDEEYQRLVRLRQQFRDR